MSTGFLTPLELEYVDGEQWKVTASFVYELRDSDEKVIIPIGFLTDFASVPRVLWNVLPPTGRYGKAAVVHDWLYQHQTVVKGDGSTRKVERSEADHVLLEAMQVLGVGWWTRSTIYSGVRVGGWKPWGEYRAAERAK